MSLIYLNYYHLKGFYDSVINTNFNIDYTNKVVGASNVMLLKILEKFY